MDFLFENINLIIILSFHYLCNTPILLSQIFIFMLFVLNIVLLMIEYGAVYIALNYIIIYIGAILILFILAGWLMGLNQKIGSHGITLVACSLIFTYLDDSDDELFEINYIEPYINYYNNIEITKIGYLLYYIKPLYIIIITIILLLILLAIFIKKK